MAKSRSYRTVIAVATVVAAAGAGAWYYFSDHGDKQPEFSTVKVARGDITQAVTATGDLEPVVTVDVGAQVSGQVQDVLVDFNTKVKANDVLARIDPAPAQQRLLQAQADLESAKANNELLRVTAERTAELYKKNLVSQSDLDTATAQYAQAKATLLTRTAAMESAKLDLQHCTIYSPIDGMVLNRATDKGRMVNSNMNAPVLFTLVNDLTKMEINAAVAEADVGSITEGQDVSFTVDAFPNRTFHGTVRQVRNAATTTSNVVSYATIIDVNNNDMKLKPGMTANVSIIVAQRNNVVRIPNAALRVRVPAELLPKQPATPGAPPAKTMTEQERRAAIRSIMTDAGVQFGTAPTPPQIDQMKKLAKDKGIEPEAIDQTVERMKQFAERMAQGGGFGGGFGRSNGASGGGGAQPPRRATLYRLMQSGTTRQLVPIPVRLGISDGVNTEVTEGLAENDDVVTSVTLPGAAAGGPGGAQNPFQQRGFGPGGFGGRGR